MYQGGENIKKIVMLSILLFFLMIPFVSAENVTIDNTISIQDTVDNVNDNDIIYLLPGTYNESGIQIDKNITLQGLGNPDEVIIDGNYENTIILVNSVSQVKFFNLTFINGKSPDYGGAIHSELGGQIYVDSCNFINNTAKINGGAINVAGEEHRVKWQVFTNNAFLNATNCKFFNNKAGHDGGAIATYRGSSYIYNSLFRHNYAERDGGSVRGGVYSTTLTENCTFENNTAKEWGGALYNWPGELTVNNCTITDNTAGDFGGALITSGPLTVTNSKIINNTAGRKGGVLFISQETPHIPSTVIFENNYVSGNTAKVGSLIYADETTATDTNFDYNYWDINPESDDWNKAFITNDLINNPTKFIGEDGTQYTAIPKVNPQQDDTPRVPEAKNHNKTNTDTTEPVTNQTTEPVTNQTEETTNPTEPVTNQTEETINIPENTTKTEETTANIPENTTKTEEIPQVAEEVLESADSQSSNSTVIEDTNIGLDTPNTEVSQSQEASQSAGDRPTAHEIKKQDVAKQTEQSPIPYIAAVIAVLAILVYGYTRKQGE